MQLIRRIEAVDRDGKYRKSDVPGVVSRDGDGVEIFVKTSSLLDPSNTIGLSRWRCHCCLVSGRCRWSEVGIRR